MMRETESLTPAPALGPLWAPDSPLATLWATATAALETENALAATHQELKAGRQALDAELVRLDGMKQTQLSAAGAAERREQAAACAAIRQKAEAHRVEIYSQLAAANLARRQAEEVYREARTHAWFVLRVLREHQRQATSLRSAVQADAERQEALASHARLAEQVGTQAAQQLADHPTLAPQWPGV